MRRGFTVIEFLVAIVILILILGAGYVTYITILKGFGRESRSAETQMEIVSGLEVMRLDVEHAGLGIGEDQPVRPVESDTNGRMLTLRSVLNTTNLLRDTATGEPVFWAVVECEGGGLLPSLKTGDNILNLPSDARLVFIGAANRNYIGDTTGNCPESGIFVAVPYDSSIANGCNSEVCGRLPSQFCNRIIYSLSATQNLDVCNENTRNLLRAVGDSDGAPILNCVADVKFTFDIDSDGDGIVDIRDGTFNNLDADGDGCVNASEVRSYLKSVNIYILIQEGGFDREFSFTNYTSCSEAAYDTRLSSDCVQTSTGVELFLPLNYRNYRWKILKLSVKPLNL